MPSGNLVFTTAHVWVMPLRYAEKVPLRLDNNIFFFDGNSSVGYSVYESYAIKGKKPVTKMLFQWNLDSGRVPHLPTAIDRRSNLNGVVLRDSRTTSKKGVLTELVVTLREKMNFTIQYVPIKPGK